MDDHDHIPTLFASILFLLITLSPQSNSQLNTSGYYSQCKNDFYNCGPLSSISYPFWERNQRPSFCGGGEPFNLHCFDDQTTLIQLGIQNFTVKEINAVNQTVKVLSNLVGNVCSPQFDDYTFSSPTPFWYTEAVHNITIFYDCPVIENSDRHIFTCRQSINLKNSTYQRDDANLKNATFHWGKVDALLIKFPRLRSCRQSIQVPTNSPPPDPGVGVGSSRAKLRKALVEGFEVHYVVSEECKRCSQSEGVCGTNGTSNQFKCHCPDDGSIAPFCSVSAHHSSKVNFSRKLIIGFVGAGTSGLLICIICCCFRRKSSTWHGKFWLVTENDKDTEAFLRNHGGLAQKRYKFSEIKKMTNSFKIKLGEGGFGAVYRGELLNGSPVAVKILKESKGKNEDFINEVASISRTSHVNVVTLVGFCLEGHKKALIYEFMSNGSLEKFIHKMGLETISSLSWEMYYQIALGIARGLEYLHRGCNTRIVHFDIKPHNILLDENFCPKISDFGLAKLCLKKESIISMSDPRGTPGYVAPEIWHRRYGGVSHKSDVYSYGMMLLDMVEGRKNTDDKASHTSEVYFPDGIYKRLEQGDLRFDGMMTTAENEIVKRLTIVGLWCIQTFPNDRPTISRVIDMLEDNLNSLEVPPKPVLSSPIISVPESCTSSN